MILKPRVLVVYKESAYSQYLSARQLSRGLKSGNYWDVVRGSHQRHQATLKGVRQILQSEGLPFVGVLREKLVRLKRVDLRFDLIISVGGDGTFLDASHSVRKIPILGVNSDPLRSIARFSGCDLESFPRVLRNYLQGKLKPLLVPRLKFSLNGELSPWLVLNDLLVTTLSPAGTSRYVIKKGNISEEQISSGIWVSTSAGSTAAVLSAGGKALPATSRKFQFVVREVYQKKYGPRKLLKGILAPTQCLEVISRMKEGRLFIDGANLVMPFRLGDRLKVEASSESMRIVGLKK